MTIATIIKNARIEKKLLLREVAQAIGIDASLLSRYEKGERLPSEDLLEVLANTLGVDLMLLQKEWLAAKLLVQLNGYPMLADEVLNILKERVEVYSARAENIPETLSDELVKLDELRGEIKAKQPLDETQITKLKDFFYTRYTYHSNRIEGNTLSLQETALVISKGITISGKSMREHLEAINHQEAVEYLEGLVQKGAFVSEQIIKELHYLVLKGIDKMHAGVYRQSEVRISGSAHIPPQHFEIAAEMQKLVQYYREKRGRLHPVLLAADLHLMLVGIHPFMDGNGRTSRLLMNLVLMQGGYYIANIKGDLTDRLEYYQALEEAHVNGNTTPFRELVASAVAQNMEEYLRLV